MLRLAFTFLVLGLIAALLGFTAIAVASMAKFFAVLFGLLSLAFLLFGLTGSAGVTA